MNSPTVFLKLNYQREVCVVSESGCHCVFQDLRAAEVLSFLHLVFVHRQRSTFSYILNSGMLALNKLASDLKKKNTVLDKKEKLFCHFLFFVFILRLSPAPGLDFSWKHALRIKRALLELNKRY